jgi:hypothetical protein
MTLLSAFGLFAVTLMLVTYALEARSHLVRSGVCVLMRAGFDVRISARRVALWIG